MTPITIAVAGQDVITVQVPPPQIPAAVERLTALALEAARRKVGPDYLP